MYIRYLVKVELRRHGKSHPDFYDDTRPEAKSTMVCDTKQDAIDLAAIINKDPRRLATPCASFHGSRTTGTIVVPLDELSELAETVADAYTAAETSPDVDMDIDEAAVATNESTKITLRRV